MDNILVAIFLKYLERELCPESTPPIIHSTKLLEMILLPI